MEVVAGGINQMKRGDMDDIDLIPRYSTNEVPGRCIKCLAEEKLFSCMRELLKEEKDMDALQQRYQILYSFLKSPDLEKLCNEAERYLAEGKEVRVSITLKDGKPEYKIKLE
jgi:hypothetical protein